ncbi:hypothetical protein ANCDUO_17175 [Ancylostoma duodenale]|uniref:Uncharacterized protein n=1 Tax=Ancylostoma duodenale TaxID=51022 RepID=A0A0C2G6M2_9BILA|nr:hypothetical protein ANCDUO_17175 [Ancylostoma duodenale]
MFNDDIAVKERGILHYPSAEFQAGFTSPPTDHYYRTYYLAVYKNWIYTGCKDGGQMQREFIDIWRRFANVYKDVCHFGFTFITSLTHEAGLAIETLDEFMKSSLENLHITGALENTVSVIMGDHGNRIGLVQYSYTGRIEERMPLMAIRLPSDFKSRNFDVHQMLKDISLMRLGEEKTPQQGNKGRGISLFDVIPRNRTCHDAYVAENFCTCLVDQHTSSMPKEKDPQKKKDAAEKKYKAAISSWITENNLDPCLDDSNMKIVGNVEILGLNPLVRHGMRTKENITAVELTRKKDPKMDFLYHEFTTTLSLPNGKTIGLLFRIEEEVAKSEFRVAFEPAVRDSPANCPSLSVFRVCDCLTSDV